MAAKIRTQTAPSALVHALDVLKRAQALNLPAVYLTDQLARVRELQHAASCASTP